MRELKEVLDSALLMVDSLTPCVARFLPKVKSFRTQNNNTLLKDIIV